jgi:hypothetical protein
MEGDAYVNDFVTNYNRTRLKCLSYKAPLEAIANLTGHNTKAGVTRRPDPLVIAGLVPAIHRDANSAYGVSALWIRGTSPGMTIDLCSPHP